MPPRHTGRLLLTPADPWLAVDPDRLRATLASLGFIGQPLATDLGLSDAPSRRLPGHAFPAGAPPAEVGLGGTPTRPPAPSQGFLVGGHFFDLLAFAGCAVNLRLSPTSSGEPFTHVHLVGPLASPLLLLGGNTRPPRCPTCRAPNKALNLFPDQNSDQDPQRDLEGQWGRNKEPDLGRNQEVGIRRDLDPGLKRDLGQDPGRDPGRQIPCPACGSRHPLWAWDWKGSAGCGRSFLWVEEVFPGEAEPTPTFQAALTSLTASPWRHFYTQDRYNR